LIHARSPIAREGPTQRQTAFVGAVIAQAALSVGGSHARGYDPGCSRDSLGSESLCGYELRAGSACCSPERLGSSPGNAANIRKRFGGRRVWALLRARHHVNATAAARPAAAAIFGYRRAAGDTNFDAGNAHRALARW